MLQDMGKTVMKALDTYFPQDDPRFANLSVAAVSMHSLIASLIY